MASSRSLAHSRMSTKSFHGLGNEEERVMEGKRRNRRSRGGRGNQSSHKMRKSCNACASAKRRCDGKGYCSLCYKRGIACVYSQRQKSGPKTTKNSDEVGGADAMVEPNPNPGSSTAQQRPRASSTSLPENIRGSKVPKSRAPPPVAASDQPVKKLARRAEPPPTSSIAGWQTAAKRHPHPEPTSTKVTQPTVSARKAPEAIKVASRPPTVPKPVKTKMVKTEKTMRTKDKKSKAASGKAPRVPLGPSATPAPPVAPKIMTGPPLPAPEHVVPIAGAPLPSISPQSPVCYTGPRGTPATPSPHQAPTHGVESNVSGTGKTAGDAVRASATVSVRQLELLPEMTGVEIAKETGEKTGEAARRLRESISSMSETPGGIMSPGSQSTCSIINVQWPDYDSSMLDITDEDLLPFFPDLNDSSNGNDVQGALAGMEAYVEAPSLGGAHLNSRSTTHMYCGGIKDSAKVGTGVALGDCKNGIVVEPIGVVPPSTLPVGTHVGKHRPTPRQPQHQQRTRAASCLNLRSTSPAVVSRRESSCINSFRQEQWQHSPECSLSMGNNSPQHEQRTRASSFSTMRSTSPAVVSRRESSCIKSFRQEQWQHSPESSLSMGNSSLQSHGYGQDQAATRFPSVDSGGGGLVVSWTEAATEAAVTSMVDAFGEDLCWIDFSHHVDYDGGGDGRDRGPGGKTGGSEGVNRRVLWSRHQQQQQQRMGSFALTIGNNGASDPSDVSATAIPEAKCIGWFPPSSVGHTSMLRFRREFR